MRSLIESIRQLVSGNRVAIAAIVAAAALVPIWIFVWPELGPVLGELWQMVLNRWQTKSL
jgi:hypothetical protein